MTEKINKSKYGDEEIQAFQRREEQRQEREFLIESITGVIKQEQLTLEELRSLHRLVTKFREIARYFELTKILSRTF